MVEHRFYHNFVVKFQDTRILSTAPDYMERILREAVELELYSNNMNKDGGLAGRVVENSKLSFASLKRKD